MKIIAAGVFFLLVIGVLIFAVRFIKNTDISLTPSSSSELLKNELTFVDIKGDFTFRYPSNWDLAASIQQAEYAPVLWAGEDGPIKGSIAYMGISRRAYAQKASLQDNIEIYSDKFVDIAKKFISESIGRRAAITIGDVSIGSAETFTTKTSAQAFVVPYTAVDTSGLVGQVKGNLYFIQGLDHMTGFASAFAVPAGVNMSVASAEKMFNGKVETIVNSFIDQ